MMLGTWFKKERDNRTLVQKTSKVHSPNKVHMEGWQHDQVQKGKAKRLSLWVCCVPKIFISGNSRKMFYSWNSRKWFSEFPNLHTVLHTQDNMSLILTWQIMLFHEKLHHLPPLHCYSSDIAIGWYSWNDQAQLEISAQRHQAYKLVHTHFLLTK